MPAGQLNNRPGGLRESISDSMNQESIETRKLGTASGLTCRFRRLRRCGRRRPRSTARQLGAMPRLTAIADRRHRGHASEMTDSSSRNPDCAEARMSDNNRSAGRQQSKFTGGFALPDLSAILINGTPSAESYSPSKRFIAIMGNYLVRRVPFCALSSTCPGEGPPRTRFPRCAKRHV